jgi:hypothetical protein
MTSAPLLYGELYWRSLRQLRDEAQASTKSPVSQRPITPDTALAHFWSCIPDHAVPRGG